METVLSRIDNVHSILKFSGTREHFIKLMENNPGILIFKFTADWCNPCKKIKDYSYKKEQRRTYSVGYRCKYSGHRGIFYYMYEV